MIHILGDGVTARAVRETLPFLGLEESPLETAELVVASPGIPPEKYPETGCEIVSEIEFAYRQLKQRAPEMPIIAITGTNGKTTVTSLVAHLADVPAYGNIGDPFITIFQKESLPAVAVIEVSSYQLEQCPTFAPTVAVYLNLTPDHLDRHGTMEAYAAAKANIYAHQRAENTLLVDEQLVTQLPELLNAPSACHVVGPKDPWMSQIDTNKYLGKHNQMNALFALRAAEKIGIEQPVLWERLQTYTFYPHRLEPVGSVEDILCINDSKATNPEATMVAISAFSQPIHLILSGYDKGLDWAPLLEAIDQSTVSQVWVTGGISDRFFRDLSPQRIPFHRVEQLSEAVDKALQGALPGDVLLFSPACSSFDAYKNFEHRGDVFREMIQSRQGETV